MSKIIASAAINGANKIVNMAERKWREAIDKYGPNQDVAFPDTAYYLPIIYGILGIPISKLSHMEKVFKICKDLLPEPVHKDCHLPYLGPVLDAGMATLFAEEMMEAIRYIENPDFYFPEEEPPEEKLWLGAANDIILRKRGIEFVDGTAPGFAAVVGSVPDNETAVKIATELIEKNLYVFMCAEYNGKRFAEQLKDAGLQLGWPVRLVPFGPEIYQAVFALGFAVRAAMSFGGIEPGDYRRILIYNKDRIFAFVLAFGYVNEEWYANAAGAINFGFPTIADTPIPQILPTGICTYEHVVSNIPHSEIVSKAVEVRGLKVTVSKVNIPVPYGPAFEGERVRKEDLYVESGGGKSLSCEWTTSLPLEEVEDGKIEVIGPEIDDIPEGSAIPMATLVEVAGREMQEDFEPILERQIHDYINYINGVMHIGQRDIVWIRISKKAKEKGLKFKHLGVAIHAKYHEVFSNILDKVQVKIYTDEEKVKEILEKARKVWKQRDERLAGITDEEVDTFYSCTLCQSFAPNHVCIVTPERTGLCGAFSYLDCRASNRINPTGPNQPVKKGKILDEKYGQWEGINEFVKKASRGAIEKVSVYSLMLDPMTTCGCCECIAVVLPLCNGIMTVNREYKGETPCGMKFTTLAGNVGGGRQIPGFLGHSKFNITQKKFLQAEGGILRLVWMPKMLKEEIKERFIKRAEEVGIPDLLDRIADETIGITEEEILPFLQEKKHPALELPPIM
ncbi:MAG: acetyl-CoA decarbonylase/synthase complex subunit alpha/beta [Candidatus Omnitrophica bacterium]|nr:acetyl-CoA decarbonylase/synthase complex subunit alpha/beta [Candidatus Omnitrophota bacterium]MCM8802074.1 acetyl-CoA decarbonylase/synthase complex subunit alpha/beta [Candidatus Omnitrophota bacterium]